MAEKRMFAKSIVLSDAFLDMPMSARCLYFTLGMLADDDGFVGAPKAIMRQCGASQDDLLVLISKRYVLTFDSGVIVIKHWRINNYLQNDRITPTTYQEELKTLTLDDKKAYTELDKSSCIQNVYEMYTQNSIEENSREEKRVVESSKGRTQYAENVSMTEEEFGKLVDQFGLEDTNRMIDILDNYKGSSGKKYKSDYRAILSWVVDRLKEEKGKRTQGSSNPFLNVDLEGI